MLLNLISDKKQQENRLKICLHCKFIKYIPILNLAQCSECGCPIKSKITINNTQCPKGKW